MGHLEELRQEVADLRSVVDQLGFAVADLSEAVSSWARGYRTAQVTADRADSASIDARNAIAPSRLAAAVSEEVTEIDAPIFSETPGHSGEDRTG